MNTLLEHIMSIIKNFNKGRLEDYPDPSAPSGLGTPLTQPEIDFVKKLKKEVEERFDPGT
jgi:hypothetical protein